ncbi:MAG TPA: Hsp70 family protein, partial [Polyangiaceae bacterium]|nr:Hsp70 family protein [Polyangiaceae bacterium]
MRLGIDFGTTRTVVACSDRGNHPVVEFADDAGDSRDHIPSMVAEREGELRFGLDALAVADDPTFTVLRSFKRLLAGGPAARVLVGRSEHRVDAIVAGFLGHVRDALLTRATVRRKLAAQAELRVAVGVPANAHAAQRLITLEAFRRAGFAVDAIVNEPSAAGFEYTHRHRATLTSRRDLVVVYDLGGGTFDASIVRMVGLHHEVLATAGVTRLGGDDFDAVLARMALAAAGFEPPPRRSVVHTLERSESSDDTPDRGWSRWMDQCRAAKEGISANTRKIALDLAAAFGDGVAKSEVTVSVAAFYEACAPLVGRSLEAMAPLLGRAEAEGAADEIAGLYVVGGGSELPLVGRALRERFGRRVHRSPYPSAAVAIGLSIACEEGAPFQLVDRYSRTFGVFREADDGRDIVLDAIFGRDAVLPTAGAPAVRTREYRPKHNIGHYRFVECDA